MTNKPERYILHHSATKDGLIFKNFDSIKDYHVRVLGYKDIAYHWVLEYINGKLDWTKGRDESVIGAHTLGHNTNAIGICVVGNFNVDILTEEHFDKLAEKLQELDGRYGMLPLVGHGDLLNTSCPGRNMNIDTILRYARADREVVEWKRVIQEKCKFSAPEGVWYILDKHPFGYDLYKKWAASYK